tara:strand:- start:857 stop:1171 length:315 start_codon:yes stop_codon:yes gene_type:complete
MKITKSQLKKIILQELKQVRDPEESQPAAPALGDVKRSTGEVRKDAMAAPKEQGAGGITAQERGLIKQLSDMLVAGSEKSNISSGEVLQKIKALAIALEKVIKK